MAGHTSGRRVPALWEPQESVFLAYPTSQYVRGHKVNDKKIQDVQAEEVKHLSKHVKVVYLVNNHREQADFESYLQKHDVDPRSVEYLVIPHCDIWLRDTGPIFVEMIDAYNRKSLVVPWAGFNNWGHAPHMRSKVAWNKCDLPNLVQRDLADSLGMAWERVVFNGNPNSMGRFELKPDQTLVLEGGSVSFNGQGTMITTSQVVFERNPDMTKHDVEHMMSEYYGVRKIIWLPKGLIEDWPLFWGPIKLSKTDKVWTPIVTTGHCDEFCRFVGVNKVLLAEVHESQEGPFEMMNRKRLAEAEKVLRQATTADGQHLEIVRIPCAPVQLMEMDRKDPQWKIMSAVKNSKLEKKKSAPVIIPASYTNYLVTNGLVLMPKYFVHGKTPPEWAQLDQRAYEVLCSVFPGREVVQLEELAICVGGGNLNCSSANMPKI